MKNYLGIEIYDEKGSLMMKLFDNLRYWFEKNSKKEFEMES